MAKFKIWRDVFIRGDDWLALPKRLLAEKLLTNASIGVYAELMLSLRDLDIEPNWNVELVSGYDESSILVQCILVLVIEDENKAALFRMWNPEYVIL